MIYDQLQPHFRDYIDALLQHAQTALWPERRDALGHFCRGISGCSTEDLDAAIYALGGAVELLQIEERAPGALEAPTDDEKIWIVFSTVLTAYLERLGETEITNPAQAELFSLSFDDEHQALAERWYAAHPEKRRLGVDRG